MTLTISKYQLSKQQHTITLNYTMGENLNHFSHLCRNFFPRIGMRFVKHEMVWLPWQPGPSNNHLTDNWQLAQNLTGNGQMVNILTDNKKPYGFIDGPFIPQDTQSKKSEYIESAWECGCYLWILLSRFLNVFLFACSRLLLTRDTLCTGFWTQNNPPLITKNNILIVNTVFQSFMLKVMNVYSILITDK